MVFSNEFFDALPVDVAVYSDGAFREQLVDLEDGRFRWRTGGPASAGSGGVLPRAYFPPPEEGRRYEANLEARALDGANRRRSGSGYVLTIDYGFTRPEAVRFPPAR